MATGSMIYTITSHVQFAVTFFLPERYRRCVGQSQKGRLPDINAGREHPAHSPYLYRALNKISGSITEEVPDLPEYEHWQYAHFP